MHLTLSSVPKKYAWILDLLGLNGSKETGIKLIDQAAKDKDSFESQEARLIYPFIANYFFQDQALAREKAGELNLDSNIALIVFLISNSKARGGNVILENITKFNDDVFELFPAAHFLIGETYLRKGDYVLARKYLNRFRNKQSSDEYLSAANLNIFLSFYLNDQPEEGKKFLSKVNVYSEKTEADRYAIQYLKNFDFDSDNYKLIWKLRLATDGGFNEKAQNLIDKDPEFINREHQTEWVYRKARFFHNTEKIDQAKTFYLDVIDNQKDNNWYYAPNSCIQLARIYLKKGNSNKAKFFINKTKQYNNYPYQESIEYEANLISREIKNEQ
nr:tetratricopeptide repeat protein [Mangrovivirga halotolerans]